MDIAGVVGEHPLGAVDRIEANKVLVLERKTRFEARSCCSSK